MVGWMDRWLDGWIDGWMIGSSSLARSREGLLDVGQWISLLGLVLRRDRLENVGQVGLEHHAAHDDLVQHKVHLVEVEDEVQLAHVLERLVERLDEDLNQIQNAQLALRAVDAEDKVERGVVAVDQLGVLHSCTRSLD